MQNSALSFRLLLTVRQIFMVLGVLLFVLVVFILASHMFTPAMAHNVQDVQPEAKIIPALVRR